jgi:hypothetical protein
MLATLALTKSSWLHSTRSRLFSGDKYWTNGKATRIMNVLKDSPHLWHYVRRLQVLASDLHLLTDIRLLNVTDVEIRSLVCRWQEDAAGYSRILWRALPAASTLSLDKAGYTQAAFVIFLASLPDLVHLEIIGGEMLQLPRPMDRSVTGYSLLSLKQLTLEDNCFLGLACHCLSQFCRQSLISLTDLSIACCQSNADIVAVTALLAVNPGLTSLHLKISPSICADYLSMQPSKTPSSIRSNALFSRVAEKVDLSHHLQLNELSFEITVLLPSPESLESLSRILETATAPVISISMHLYSAFDDLDHKTELILHRPSFCNLRTLDVTWYPDRRKRPSSAYENSLKRSFQSLANRGVIVFVNIL